MTTNNETKTLCYLVLIKDLTYMFNTKIEAEKFFKTKKLMGEKPVLSSLVSTTTTTISNRIIGC